MSESHTRRDVLKTGVVGSLGVVGLSGCLGGGGDNESEEKNDNQSQNGSNQNGDNESQNGNEQYDKVTEYTKWLYAPRAVEKNHYFFRRIDHQDIRDSRDSLEAAGVYEAQTAVSDRFPLTEMGVEYEEIDQSITAGRSRIFLGSFNESDVAEGLKNRDFDVQSEHRGFKFFVKGADTGGRQKIIALSGGTAVASERSGSEEDEIQNIVETLIDTSVGEEDQYVDESEDMAVLADALGTRTIIYGSFLKNGEKTNSESLVFNGQVATGVGVQFNGETTERLVVLLFSNSDDIDIDAIEARVDSENPRGATNNLTITKSGRSVILTNEVETSDYFGQEETDGGNNDDTNDGNDDTNGGTNATPEELVDTYLSDNAANGYDGTDSIADMTGEDSLTIEVGAGENDLAFSPVAVRVDAGTEITWEWVNVEAGGHNVSLQEGPTAFQSDVYTDVGETFTQTLDQPGAYRYQCDPHKFQGMHGALIVE